MYILVIDTTGPVGSCALLEPETGAIRQKTTEEPMAHLRRLAGMMEELVQETGCSKSEIGAVSASAGPGSYTGIRIGVTTARMTAQALGVPCLKVPTLAMFRPLAGDTGCAVIFNARRGQVYGAVYGPGGQEVLAPGPYMLEDVTKAAERAGLNPVFYGDGIDAYRDSPKYGNLLAGKVFAPKAERYQTAELAARFTKTLWEQGDTCSVEELLPDYMRKTEAEQKLADGSLARARAAKMAKFRSR
ncbi:tRNA (adenosine(37)-N6)-threonylcarbamoyltransferase complex dimerization subunit type 1 TsaB [uncultured Eubacterium sp.]|uniref:tRNA (adenosine(37)-N6)-threonylcarbamoyltransferase complex dimerization subunit type 1 TsaB n=1 Tax=Eubacterium pyruvativorans TaxID=155865 RepID=UPI00259898B7|nr:tRNA (adenosine(37)-N6)-threonylcarbamoyltransferase complex dimerization subunit type 1 TsaB [uncultured Eubacterium sp.]